ncbi:hypothetical protein THRCLA_03156 [Thraustotheca clavata]|uniref:Uncharacterized protein n=1 Tax=Thraustotheca clavata TaxID=74557 RepID=A0A1W0A2W9_9STRA|nr:hypothetical protein THRCLA_03156 [Thraustotheca clavata]
MWSEVSKYTLIVLNIGFVVAGALLIYIGATNTGGWTDVFNPATNAATVSVFHLVLAFGILVLLIALMGLFGAMKRSKCLLYTYALFVFIALVIFVLIMITGFTSASTANKWDDATFPAENAETSVAEAFDTAYCSVLVDHYCVSGSVSDAMSIFSSTSASAAATIIKLFNLNADERVGFKNLCASLNTTSKDSLGTVNVETFNATCTACKQAGSVDFSSLYDWAQDHCPLTTSSATWCVNYLNTKNYASPDVVYTKCRPAVLDLFKKFANKIAIGSLVFSCVSLILLIMACTTARTTNKDQDVYTAA